MALFEKPWKISGIAGILFVALSFVAMAVNKMPPVYTSDAAEMTSWFAANASWYRGGHMLAGIAFLLFYFPFFAGFCERLREAEGTPAVWSRVAWAGAVVSPAVGTIAGSFLVGLALLEGRVSPDAAPFGLAANFYAYVVSGAFGGIAMIGAAVVILKTAVFRRWLGWAGLAVGFPAVISTAAIVENDPEGLFAAVNSIAWLLYFLWIAALSVELIRAPSAERG